jgi:predicted transcriptional regulator
MAVREYCNHTVVTVPGKENVVTAAQVMREKHVGDVVVIEERDGKQFPKGLLTDRDIVVELIAESVNPETVTVGDAMSDDLLVLAEDMEIDKAVSVMAERGVRRAPVVDREGALSGILTVDDILESLVERLVNLSQLVYREQRQEHERRSRP